MALDLLVKTEQQGQLTLSDGTGTPVTLVCSFDQGDFSFGPLRPDLQEYVKIERRGRLITVTPGARIYPSGSFTAYVSEFSNATAGVITDFVMFQGAYSANVSTLGASHPGPKTIDLIFDLEGSDYGGNDSQVTFTDCVLTIDSFSESADGDTVSISFECLGEVTGDLAAAEIA